MYHGDQPGACSIACYLRTAPETAYASVTNRVRPEEITVSAKYLHRFHVYTSGNFVSRTDTIILDDSLQEI